MFALPLHPVVLVLQLPQSGTHSHLALATLPLPILSVAFLKLTASSRPSAPPSVSPKCLRFGHLADIAHFKHSFTYLLTKLVFVLQSDSVGVLKVSGYIRGQALSANHLVHLPGWGDFQLLQIDTASEPYPDSRPKIHSSSKRGITPMVISVSIISQVIFRWRR